AGVAYYRCAGCLEFWPADAVCLRCALYFPRISGLNCGKSSSLGETARSDSMKISLASSSNLLRSGVSLPQPPGGAVVVGGDYQGLGIVRSLGRHKIPVCIIDDEYSIYRYSKYATHVVPVASLR